MGKGVYHCRAKSIDLLMPMVVQGAIGNEDYTLVVAFRFLTSYQMGIISGDAVTCLDGCLAAIQ